MTVFKRKDGFDWVLKDGQHLGREREENEAAQLGNCPSKSKNGNESQLCPSDSEQPISESGVGQFPSTLCTHTHTHPHTHPHNNWEATTSVSNRLKSHLCHMPAKLINLSLNNFISEMGIKYFISRFVMKIRWNDDIRKLSSGNS